MSKTPVYVRVPQTAIPPELLSKVGQNYLKADYYLDPSLEHAAMKVSEIGNLKAEYDDLKKFYQIITTALTTEDPSRTVEAHMLDVKARYDKRLAEIEKRRGEMAASIAGEINSINDDIEKIADIREGIHSREIRDHVRRLKPAERATFLHEAIEKGDKESVVAVLTARSYLSGLSDEQQSVFRDLYIEKVAEGSLHLLRTVKQANEINDRTLAELRMAGAAFFPEAKVTGITDRINRAQAARNDVWQSAGAG